METLDFGLQKMKEAWLVFQEARDEFEKNTFELRKRYVRFAFAHKKGKSNDFKFTAEQHLDALNPKDFDDMLLFLDKDSIFGSEYHQVPVAYLADPDKWEADFFVEEEERKRVDARRAYRMELQRLKSTRAQITKSGDPDASLRNADFTSADSLESYVKLKDLLIKEVTEAGGKEAIDNAVSIVALVAQVPEDYVHTALVLAEERKELFVKDIEVYTPEEYDFYFGEKDNGDEDEVDDYANN